MWLYSTTSITKSLSLRQMRGLLLFPGKTGTEQRSWAIQWIVFIKMLNCISRKLCLRKHVLLSWPVFTYFKINVRDILSLLWNSGISWSTAVKQQLIIKITYRSSVMSNLMQRQLRNLCFCGSLTSIITAKVVLVNFRLHGIMAFYR